MGLGRTVSRVYAQWHTRMCAPEEFCSLSLEGCRAALTLTVPNAPNANFLAKARSRACAFRSVRLYVQQRPA